MSLPFYDNMPGPERRDKFNQMWQLFQQAVEEAVGPKGWSPKLSLVSDGARKVFAINDWVGGEGTKPALTGYIGATGIVANIADAIDVAGTAGPDGKEVELSATATEIRWRYVGDVSWNSLVAISSLKGEDGKPIELQNNGSQVQWRYSGELTWNDLISLSAISGDDGTNGWTPVPAGVVDGARVVIQVTDWVGGTGAKPTIGLYVGPTGFVTSIVDAVDVRGPVGADGNTGPANSLQIGTVTEGPVASASISGVPPLQTLDLTLPQATDGADGADGWSPIFAAVADGERRALQLVDWTGGTGTKPATGAYVGATGLVALVANATDIRGAEGAAGSGSGDVLGPAASVDNEVVLFDGATGKVIKGGGVLGTAAFSSASSFATATQGTKADTAVQPGSLGTASTRNVAATGDASTTQVVLGSDTRLTNARPASDVSAWAKAATKPSYTKSEVGLSNVDNTSDASKSVLSATKLTTARTINGVSFDGSANISVPADWSSVTGKPAVIAAGADAAAARSAIGAGTSNLTLGTTAGTALAGNTTLLPEAPSDGKTYGRKNAAWAEVVSGGGSGYATGDVLVTARTLSTPDYVLPDTVYLQSSYPDLFAIVGTLGDGRATKTKLPNPSTLPAADALDCSWDASGKYLAVVNDAVSPYLIVYERSGSTLSKLSDPATMPVSGYACAWSPDGGFLAVGSSVSPYLHIYQRSGSTLTKITDPSSMPTTRVNGVSWSADGKYLALGLQTSPYIAVYERSGTTFTKLADPASLPGSPSQAISCDASGSYIAVASLASPFMAVYERAGSTLTKLSNPATLPASQGNACAWSPSGEFLAVGHNSSPYVSIYQRVGATLTKLANPASLPAAAIYGCAWDSTGQYLALGTQITPFITVYQRGATTFTKLANPSTLPTGFGRGVSWAASGGYLAVAHTTTPFITVYSSFRYDPTTHFQTPSVAPLQQLPIKTYIKA